MGTFKLDFDGVEKGNPSPAGYGGVIRNIEGNVLSVFWGDLGETMNNVTKLEGLVSGLRWALQQLWIPLLVEGDSMLIISMAG